MRFLSFTSSDTELLSLREEFYVGSLCIKANLEYDRCVWGLMGCTMLAVILNFRAKDVIMATFH